MPALEITLRLSSTYADVSGAGESDCCPPSLLRQPRHSPRLFEHGVNVVLAIQSAVQGHHNFSRSDAAI